MKEPIALVAARRDAALARERLLQAAHELQARVAPKRLADEVLEAARQRGTRAFEAARDAAQRRPGAAAGIAVGLLAFVARRRIYRLFRRRRRPAPIPAAPERLLPRLSGDTE